MPQVLSNYPDATVSAYGPGFLPGKYPKIANFVLQVISAQAHIDAYFDHVYIHLMGAEPKLAFAGLDALSGSEARRNLIRSVARAALSEQNYNLLLAVQKIIKPTRDRRNDFAHGMWGDATRPTDSPVLIPPVAITSALASDRGKPYQEKTFIDPSLCYVYTEKDAIQIYFDSNDHMRIAGQFLAGINWLVEISNEKQLDQLRSDPLVAPTLQKMSQKPTL